MCRFVVFTVCFLLCVINSKCFEPVIKNLWAVGDVDSYFGFSVQLANKILVVGAPKHSGSGAAFTCNNPSETCRQLPLKIKPNADYESLTDNQWLGSTLDIFGSKIVACAPRWINRRHKIYNFLNGLCFVYDTNSNNTDLLIPLFDPYKQIYIYKRKYYYYLNGEAGFSMNINPEGSLTLGAPGVFNWLGSFARYNLKTIDGESDPFVPNPLMFNSDVIESLNASMSFDTKYFGYAVSSGRLRDGRLMYIAGVPRANNLIGHVSFFIVGYILKNYCFTINGNRNLNSYIQCTISGHIVRRI